MNNESNSRSIKIRDVDIKRMYYKNFSGAPSDIYNPGEPQTPNFGLILDENRAHELEDLGFRVKWKPNKSGSLDPRLSVYVRFDQYPPKIIQVYPDGKSISVDEDGLADLDQLYIAHADVAISRSSRGRTYLTNARFFIEDRKNNSDNDDPNFWDD